MSFFYYLQFLWSPYAIAFYECFMRGLPSIEEAIKYQHQMNFYIYLNLSIFNQILQAFFMRNKGRTRGIFQSLLKIYGFYFLPIAIPTSFLLFLISSEKLPFFIFLIHLSLCGYAVSFFNYTQSTQNENTGLFAIRKLTSTLIPLAFISSLNPFQYMVLRLLISYFWEFARVPLTISRINFPPDGRWNSEKDKPVITQKILPNFVSILAGTIWLFMTEADLYLLLVFGVGPKSILGTLILTPLFLIPERLFHLSLSSKGSDLKNFSEMLGEQNSKGLIPYGLVALLTIFLILRQFDALIANFFVHFICLLFYRLCNYLYLKKKNKEIMVLFIKYGVACLGIIFLRFPLYSLETPHQETIFLVGEIAIFFLSARFLYSSSSIEKRITPSRKGDEGTRK